MYIDMLLSDGGDVSRRIVALRQTFESSLVLCIVFAGAFGLVFLILQYNDECGKRESRRQSHRPFITQYQRRTRCACSGVCGESNSIAFQFHFGSFMAFFIYDINI